MDFFDAVSLFHSPAPAQQPPTPAPAPGADPFFDAVQATHSSQPSTQGGFAVPQFPSVEAIKQGTTTGMPGSPEMKGIEDAANYIMTAMVTAFEGSNPSTQMLDSLTPEQMQAALYARDVMSQNQNYPKQNDFMKFMNSFAKIAVPLIIGGAAAGAFTGAGAAGGATGGSSAALGGVTGAAGELGLGGALGGVGADLAASTALASGAGAVGGVAGGVEGGTGITAAPAEGGLSAGLSTTSAGQGLSIAPVESVAGMTSGAAAPGMTGALGTGISTAGATGALAPGALAAETLTVPAALSGGEVATGGALTEGVTSTGATTGAAASPATSPAATTAAGTAGAGALSQAETAALVESGTTGTAGAALEASALGTGSIDQFLAAMPAATQSVLGTLGLGTASEALDKLIKLGLPIATIAGLFEEPNNPLLGPIVQAAQKAIGQADIYAGLGPVGLTPAQQQAIDLAKANVGNYQPYVNKAGALADTAAGGITQDQIDRYTNPYLEDVLNPAITDIEEASARRREQLRAITSMSGNDLRTPSTDPNRFNVEDSLLDRETLRAIGDVSGKLRAQGFDAATGLAGKDLDRSLSSSSLYSGLGKTVGALGASDVESLKGAGALERLPQDEERAHAANASKLYTDVVHGNQGALGAAAQPSTLTNVTGALGALKTAKDLDLF